MSRMLGKTVSLVRVPRGSELRLLCAALAFSVGFPRLPFAHDIFAFASTRFGEPEAWGVLFVAISILLLVTCYKGRLSWYGRVIAGVAFVSWIALSTSSFSITSLLVDLSIAVAMLWEAGTNGQ